MQQKKSVMCLISCAGHYYYYYQRLDLRLPDGYVVNADVLLGHAEQQVRELNVEKEREILHLPVHV